MTTSPPTTRIHHATLVFERIYDASPARVFAAYADVDARAAWGAPSDTAAIVYTHAEFRVGGRDAYRCGGRDDLRYAGEVAYVDIIPDRRIVFSETIRADHALLSAALITWELDADGAGTRLLVTDQVASMVGDEMVIGTRQGTTAALDHLRAWLASRRS